MKTPKIIEKIIKPEGAFKVKYNGGFDSYFPCTSPSELERGKVYDVEEITEQGCRIAYHLCGIEGIFNSVWFDRL